jgi:hypothetical protein
LNFVVGWYYPLFTLRSIEVIRFLKLLILAGFCFSLLGVVVAQGDDGMQIAQWAERAEASSQFTDDSWSAEQATGSPDVFDCGDNSSAWASESYETEIEWLAVTFRETVIPTQVNIYQSFNPGAIIAIGIVPANGDDPIIFEDLEDLSNGCPSVFSISLPDGLPESNGLVIVLNQTLVGDWNEIDAVELVGITEGDPEDSEESSIESGDYPEYAIFSASVGDSPSSQDNSPSSSRGSDGNYDVEWGRDVVCDDGSSIENGVELTIVQQRTGNQYRITVVGIDAFDPVLAVTLSGNYNDTLCNDDSEEAADYEADLPSTGQVDAAGINSQVLFNLNTSSAFEDVSIIVGGFGESSGEFLVIVEGMFAGEADGLGDPFSLDLSPALYESDVAPTAYMIAVTDSFDPLLFLVDGKSEVMIDENGDPIGCDDAGNENLCWGESSNMAGSYISRSGNRQLPGGNLDAMLTIEIPEDWVGSFYDYVMAGNNSFGDYVAVFHLGIAGE